MYYDVTAASARLKGIKIGDHDAVYRGGLDSGGEISALELAQTAARVKGLKLIEPR